MEYDHVNRIQIKKMNISLVAENEMMIEYLKSGSMTNSGP
jgi:hypothetical protein